MNKSVDEIKNKSLRRSVLVCVVTLFIILLPFLILLSLFMHLMESIPEWIYETYELREDFSDLFRIIVGVWRM